LCGSELSLEAFSGNFTVQLISKESVMKIDVELQQDIVAELQWERALRSDKITVAVSDGAVTLSGEVGSFSEKLTVERATRRVSGVKQVCNTVQVNLLSPDRRTDKEILNSCTNVLRSLAHLPKESIKVEVVDGVVSLSGVVDWQCQKLAAMTTVSNLSGIKAIDDQIVINVGESSKVVQAEIEAALERCALAYSRLVTVQVKGSNVTLSGRVSSWSERELAKQAAWGSPGVLKVIDQMTASY
jgi:osmotically-inducible protein OsmY